MYAVLLNVSNQPVAGTPIRWVFFSGMKHVNKNLLTSSISFQIYRLICNLAYAGKTSTGPFETVFLSYCPCTDLSVCAGAIQLEISQIKKRDQCIHFPGE
jgi:hypothetical protein